MFVQPKDCSIIKLKKKSGKIRLVYNPKDEIKEKQREHLFGVIYRELPYSYFAHGFVRGRSIVSNARPHVNKKFILKIDIKNFFPSITWFKFCEEYKWKFRKYPDNAYQIHFLKHHNGRIVLEQGFPASPAISNFVLFRFDIALYNYLINLQTHYEDANFAFTRYADDITISSNNINALTRAKYKVFELLHKNGFQFNKKKLKVIPYWLRQVVTGIVVNKKINLPRKERKRLRAIQHQLRKGYIKETNHIKGKLSFQHMVEIQREQFVLPFGDIEFTTTYLEKVKNVLGVDT